MSEKIGYDDGNCSVNEAVDGFGSPTEKTIRSPERKLMRLLLSFQSVVVQQLVLDILFDRTRRRPRDVKIIEHVADTLGIDFFS